MTSGARDTIRAAYLVGCDGGRSSVRETLGVGMVGTAALTYTTNVIFRCPGLVRLHDKGRAYRFIILGPEGTWSTIVAINGTDQWRFSIIGGNEPREYSTDEIHALIRRAVGRDFDFEILTVMRWVRRELVAERYGEGRVYMAGDAVHMLSPTGAFDLHLRGGAWTGTAPTRDGKSCTDTVDAKLIWTQSCSGQEVRAQLKKSG